MYEKEFSLFGNILNIDNFKKVCLDEYDSYLDTVIEFKENEETLQTVYNKYKDSLLNLILSNEDIKDLIMTDEKHLIRHDKGIEKSVDVQKLSERIFQGNKDDLNYFEQRARAILLLEVASMINCYGVEELSEKPEIISKEMRLGIYKAKTDKYLSIHKLEMIKERTALADTYGEDSIEYIENFDLLVERVQSLRDYSKNQEEIKQLDELIKKLSSIKIGFERKDGSIIPLLKDCFSNYERINRNMLVSRLKKAEPEVIDDPNDEELVLLHFIPNFKSPSDIDKSDFLKDVALTDYINDYFEAKYGRKYDPEIDAEEAGEIAWMYFDSRKNPFDFNSRLPLKNKYMNNSFRNVITDPLTNLSCSIGRIGDLYPHLDRKIAIGFSPVDTKAIKKLIKDIIML